MFEFEQSVTQEQAKCLVDGLRDPFDANRLLCLELLYKLKSEKIGLNVSWKILSEFSHVPLETQCSFFFFIGGGGDVWV